MPLPTKASMTVVESRGYSRMVGRMRDDTDTRHSGAISAMMAAVRSSCSEFRKLNRKLTATASTSFSFRLATARRTSSSSSGVCTLPR